MTLLEFGDQKKITLNVKVIASAAPWVIGDDNHTQIIILAHDPGCSMPIRYEIDEPYASVVQKLENLAVVQTIGEVMERRLG